MFFFSWKIEKKEAGLPTIINLSELPDKAWSNNFQTGGKGTKTGSYQYGGMM